MLPRKIFKITPSEIESEGISNIILGRGNFYISCTHISYTVVICSFTIILTSVASYRVTFTDLNYLLYMLKPSDPRLIHTASDVSTSYSITRYMYTHVAN